MKIQVVKCSGNYWYKSKQFPIKTEVIEAVDKEMYDNDDYNYNEFLSTYDLKDFYYSKQLMGYIAKVDCINDSDQYDLFDSDNTNSTFVGLDVIKRDESKPTKQSDGKLFYELDWEFIEGMAKRMALNKQNGKYDVFGWRDNYLDIEAMKQAQIRHLIAVLKGESQDDEQLYSHYYALACNSMLMVNQLKKDNEFN